MKICEIEEIKIIVEGVKDKNFLASISFVASVGDKLNSNGRLYKSAILKREAKRFEKKTAGQLNHPDSGNSDLDKVSHTIEKLWFDDKKKALMATAKVLKTTSGQDLMKLINAGVSLGASTRGYGNMIKKQDKNGIDYAEISADYRLGAVDIVSQPSFGQDTLITTKNMKVFESVGLDQEKEITEEVKSEIEKERRRMQDVFKTAFEKQRVDLVDEDFEDVEDWLEARGVDDAALDKLLTEGLIEWAEDKNLSTISKKDFLEWKQEEALSEKDLIEVAEGKEGSLEDELFQFEEALSSGYKKNFETWKLEQKEQEEDEELIRVYDEAVDSGYRGDFETWKETLKK